MPLHKVGKITDPMTKTILYWNVFWGKQDFYIGFGAEPFRTCEYKNCFATNYKTFKPIDEFDAIIFHPPTYNLKYDGKPNQRNERQVYIFHNMETPATNPPDFTNFNSFYNWSMTYRLDSDIITRYGEFFEDKSNYTLPSVQVIKKKTKLVAWFASNCKTPSQREKLAEEINKFLPVDIYGKCGTLKCERTQEDMCYEMLEEKYKFYLSFENSICKDYWTEKLYNVLKKNVVPIVYGAGNYSLSAPPHSVINVADFDTVKQLTDYLMHLDKNVTEYLKYFEWKKKFKIVKNKKACGICKKLHEPLRKSVYDDLKSWSWGKKGEICKTGKNLPQIVQKLL
ncbi:alpha-(1,3)-fucosyltransferase C-like [Photinus pyralis]|uniref:alpha-(1,3)-fucosyltransferase C-like n=1 Tax=Photinus pyralis TaxID=7054 RepID=UPI0012673874|nr:alpha-(1,3)-fucosyltransferase C-like [Photinus pyralis]